MDAARAGLTAVVGVVLGAVTAEAATRVVHPPPRVQAVRTDLPHQHVERRGEVPLWWFDDEADGLVRGGPCAAGQRRVGLVGDSVFEASLPKGRALGTRLAEPLGRLGVDACVLDASWSGYLPYQVSAALDVLDEGPGVDLAVVEVYKEDLRWHDVGGLLWDLDRVETDADGLPPALVPLPAALHRTLFSWSEAWRLATLAGAVRREDPVRDPAGAYLDLLARAARDGRRLVLVEAPSLDQPFARTAAARATLRADHWLPRVQAAAEAAGVPYVRLADALVDQDVEAVRADVCCHYKDVGHAAIAEALAPVIAEALRR